MKMQSPAKVHFSKGFTFGVSGVKLVIETSKLKYLASHLFSLFFERNEFSEIPSSYGF